MKIETTDLQINATGATTAFRLTVDGTGEAEQALDLVSHVLRYGEPAPAPPALGGAIIRAAVAFVDANAAHQAQRTGATGKAQIKAMAALRAAVEAVRS
jgi:hypothetical protein